MEMLAPHLPGFLAAYAILAVAASSPGPAVAFLFGIGTAQGRAAAMSATLGIATGSILLNLLTLVGVGLLVQQAAWAMQVLRLIGAAYLLWLAWGAFRRAAHPPEVRAQTVQRRAPWHHFVAGFLLQVTNPKAIAFWLAIASVGAVEGADPAVMALFIAGAFLISFFCHGAWAVALSAPSLRRAYAAGRRWIEGGLGVFFIFAASKLATGKV